jgi:hypothetical protein
MPTFLQRTPSDRLRLGEARSGAAQQVLKTYAWVQFAPLPVDPELFSREGERTLSQGIRTRLAGILYLIELLEWLDSPLEEESNDQKGGTLTEQLSFWTRVEALARGLLGNANKSFEGDPIWSILACLDGREPGAPIGDSLPVQADFRLPARWLRRLGPASHTWVALQDGTRLRLVDPSHDYLVADVALNGLSPDKVAATEIEAYLELGVRARYMSAFSLHTLPLPELLPTVLTLLGGLAAWWLERTLDFVRYALPDIMCLQSQGYTPTIENLLRERALIVARCQLSALSECLLTDI